VSSFRHYVRQQIQAVRPEDMTVPKEPMLPVQVAEVDYGWLGRCVDPPAGSGARIGCTGTRRGDSL
jgi:hypothetical protein